MTEREVPRRILAIDVGAGTQDILVYESGRTIENSFKLVMPSRTVIVAGRIRRATALRQPLFLTGRLMGGGASSRAVRAHLAAGLPVSATPPAAKTLHDNLNQVREMGVAIRSDVPSGATVVEMGDVDLTAIRDALAEFDVDLPSEAAVAVQDHGDAPHQSNRLFRFEHWRRFVESGGELADLAYVEPPTYLTRMRAVQSSVPGALVMDTGVAAIWGALGDEEAARRVSEGIVVVNVGNAHVLAALVRDARVLGLFEHHTGALTTDRLGEYLARLLDGTIDGASVLADGGHGAAVRADFGGWPPDTLVVVTGPNRHLAKGLNVHMAVPYGDMMLSGCFGLLAGRGIEPGMLGGH